MSDALRYLLRRLARTPGTTAAIVLSLAVGMASVITLLGVVDSLFFREPAGMRDGARVVAIGPWAGFDRTSFPDYTDLRDQARSLQSVAAFAFWNYSARVGNAVSSARGLLATQSLLPTLGITPDVGRGMSPDEDRPGAPSVVMIGSQFSAAHFASDADALGKIVKLAGTDFTIIGVLPGRFTAPDMSPVDLLLPIENAPWFGGREALVNRDYRWVRILGRLKPGVSPDAASSDATAIYRRANVGARAVDQATLAREVVPVRSLAEARRDPKAPSVRIAVWLTALAAVVLLIACSNVASLLVARGIADAHDVAIRIALGASTSGLVARLLFEVGAMVVAAAALGLAVAAAASRALVTLLLGNTLAAAPVDLRTALASLGVAATTCLVCAVAPVVRMTRVAPQSVLGRGSRTTTSAHGRALRGLVAIQVALGVVLVSEATIFAVSLRNAMRTDLGFDLARLVVADVDLRAAGVNDTTAIAAESRAVDAVRRIRGVVSVGMTNAASVPGYLNPPVQVPGRDSAPPGLAQFEPSVSSVTPGFLEALDVPLLRGRLFTDDDVTARRAIALVSDRFAKLYWRGMDPIGQCARIGRLTTTPCAEIIGIVGDRRASPTDAHGMAEMYLPAASAAFPPQLATTFLGREIAVRVGPGRPDITAELQQTLLDAVPGLTSARVRVADAYLENQTRSWRLGAVVIGVFASIALALAAIGVFSVWSNVVAARRRELGIRGALGALPRDLAWLVVREALIVAAVGIAVGLAGALAAGRVVRALTFGISPLDPRVLAATAGVFGIVTCLGALIPALRAAFTEPRSVLAD
jgi:predicted permease